MLNDFTLLPITVSHTERVVEYRFITATLSTA